MIVISLFSMAISVQRFNFFPKLPRNPNFNFLRFPQFYPFSTSKNSDISIQDQEYHQFIESIQFDSKNPQINSNPNPNLDESKILNELSNIFSINRTKLPNSVSPPIENPKTLINPSPDDFLTIEDKLRGVFYQKLYGKPSIENALSFALGSEKMTIDIVSRVLDRGDLGGENMVTFFDWLITRSGIKRDVKLYNVLLKALGRRKHVDFMVNEFKKMSKVGVNPNYDTLMIVLDSFVKSRRMSNAFEVFKELKRFGMECDTEAFNVFLRCLCKRSYVKKAHSLLVSMKGSVVFDCVSYNIVIGGWARLGRVVEMESCLKEMLEDGFLSDCRTYSSIIECLGHAGRIDDAVNIFDSMEAKGCLRDAGVYSAMISIYVSQCDFSKCMFYYEEMLKNNFEPDLDTYRIIIKGLTKARKVSDVLEMFDKMLCRGIVPTAGVVTSFIGPLCGFGPPHAAMMLYKSARKYGCEITLTCYKRLFLCLSRFGKSEMLLKVWEEMQESGHSADRDVYQFIVNGLCNSGKLDTAVFVMEEALSKGFCLSKGLCFKLNNKLLAADKVRIAYKLFLKIKQARIKVDARNQWRARGWHY